MSPLGRAVETCKLAGMDERAETREELLEFDYGDYEGLTTAEIRETVPGWTVWTHGSKNGEMPADVGARLDPLIAELRAADGRLRGLRPRPRPARARRALDRARGGRRAPAWPWARARSACWAGSARRR